MRRYSFKKRLLFLVFSVLALFIILMMRLFYLQVIQGGKWKEEGDRQYKSELVEKAKRGKIYSSDGEILAFDVETYEVVLDPTIIKEENIDEIICKIRKKSKLLKTACRQHWFFRCGGGHLAPPIIRSFVTTKLPLNCWTK